MCGSTPFNSSKSRWIKPHSPIWWRSTFIAVDKNCIRYKHNSPAFHQEVNKPHISSPCHISPSVKSQSLHERPSPCQPTVSWAQARFDWDECLQVQNVPKNTCLSNHGVISCLLICHSDIKIKKNAELYSIYTLTCKWIYMYLKLKWNSEKFGLVLKLGKSI